jgi:hypothetical protein
MQEESAKVGFYGSSRHIQLFCDFTVIAALNEQVHNLLFTPSPANCRIFHVQPSLRLTATLRVCSEKPDSAASTTATEAQSKVNMWL